MSREMKYSGIAWIGDIPKSWEVRKMRTLGSFSASGIDKLINPDEPLVRIINYVDVYNNGKYELRQKDYMIVSATPEKITEHQVQIGDMILTPSSETIDDIGVSSVVMEELPNTAYSYHVLRFRSKIALDLYFKKYLTNNRFVAQYFSSHCNGTIRKTVSREVFKECPVIIPPLAEQKAIAGFLDKKCNEIDELVALQEKMIEELKAYKQSVITEAVCKGLNPNVPMKDSGIEWIGNIPSDWRTDILSVLFYEHKLKNKGMAEQNLLSLSYGNIIRKDITQSGGLLPESFETYNIVDKDDIIFRLTDLQNDKRSLRTGLCKERGIITSAYIAIRKRTNIHAPYFHYLFHTYDLCKVFYGLGDGVRQGMNYVDMRKLPLIIPSYAEQKAIADFLDKKCNEIDQLIAIKQQKIVELNDYKKSLIYEYATGKKEVKL